MNPGAPMFSIGITTYNRRALLKETLRSVINQTYSDFEVIVGNDYTAETLSAGVLGIEDPRVRFVNHSKNLGELANMNALLGMGRARYFTWQFDDDLYTPNFLAAVHSALLKFNFPPCVFTSHETTDGTSFPVDAREFPGQKRLYTGRQFLRMYFSGKLKAMGCTGVYDAKYLKQMGGVEPLTDGPFALYSEYLLLVRAGLLERVAYVDEPLILYRTHDRSWGSTNTAIALYKQAGNNLIRESVKVFSRPKLRNDFYKNLSSILKLSLNALATKLAARDGYLNGYEVMGYLFSIKAQFNSLKGSVLYWIALAKLCQLGVGLIWPIAKLKFKSVAPAGLVKVLRMVKR